MAQATKGRAKPRPEQTKKAPFEVPFFSDKKLPVPAYPAWWWWH